MHLETNYTGIYRGIVIDSNDPLDKGRVRLKVPQVSGDQITGWAWPIVGAAAGIKTPYISAIDVTNQPSTQPASSNSTPVNTGMVVSLGTFVEGYGISLANNAMTFSRAGVYNIQFSIQLVSTNASTSDVQIWIAKNGVAVDQSAGQVTIGGSNAGQVPAWNYVLSLNAGDTIKFYWATNANHVYIASNPTAIDGAPHTPGVIVTAVLENSFTPISGDSCWVMFEGGDPNFPLWLGTF